MNGKNLREKFTENSLASKVLREVDPSGSIYFEKDKNIPSIKAIQLEDKVIKICVEDKEKTVSFLEDIILSTSGTTEEEALKKVIAQEDRIFKHMLLKASEQNNEVISDDFTYKGITKSNLETVQYEVERHRLVVDKFLMSTLASNDILENKENFPAQDFDKITEQILLDYSLIGSIWGVNIFDMGFDLLPLRAIFAVTDGRYLGGKRINSIKSTTLDNSNVKVTVNESLSIINPRAVACLLDDSYTSNRLHLKKIKEIDKKYKELYLNKKA